MIDSARVIVTGGPSVVLDLSASVTESAQSLSADHPPTSGGSRPCAHAWAADAASECPAISPE